MYFLPAQLRDKIEIRKPVPGDISALVKFFRLAFGPQTVFLNPEFVRWYLFGPDTSSNIAAGSIICLDIAKNQIVSFYGGLASRILINRRVVPIYWGASAFTLPDYRAKGLNSSAIDFLKQGPEILGVIGFSKKTADFYLAKGYNLFSFRRFTRFVYIISKVQTIAAAAFLKKSNSFEIPFPDMPASHSDAGTEGRIIKVTSSELSQLSLDFEVPVKLTTWRDKNHLLHRFLAHPYITYQVYAFIKDQRIRAYIAWRAEVLEPLNISVCRIIDLFGNEDGVAALLKFVAFRAEKAGNAYVDFSAFGNLYSNVLTDSSFIKLNEDDAAILPQVTSPVTDRPNMEYVGLFARDREDQLLNLSEKDVYFTRMDSDRDRLARLDQLPNYQQQNGGK